MNNHVRQPQVTDTDPGHILYLIVNDDTWRINVYYYIKNVPQMGIIQDIHQTWKILLSK